MVWEIPGSGFWGLVVNSIRIGFGCGGAIWRKVEVEVGFWEGKAWGMGVGGFGWKDLGVVCKLDVTFGVARGFDFTVSV